MRPSGCSPQSRRRGGVGHLLYPSLRARLRSRRVGARPIPGRSLRTAEDRPLRAGAYGALRSRGARCLEGRGSAGRKPRRLPLIERAGASEGHQRRLQGSPLVVEVQKLLPRGRRSVGGDHRVGIQRSLREFEVQVYPGTPRGAEEPSAPYRARLELVVRSAAEHRLHRQRLRRQRIEPDAQLPTVRRARARLATHASARSATVRAGGIFIPISQPYSWRPLPRSTPK